MSELPGGTLTVLHTDVEGSTLLTVRLRDRYPEVLATHCTLLRAAFAAHEGCEVVPFDHESCNASSSPLKASVVRQAARVFTRRRRMAKSSSGSSRCRSRTGV